MLIKSCISQSELSNCDSDTNSVLLEVFGTPCKQCANDTAVIVTDDVLGTTELAAIDVNSIPQQNALFYVGGYICKTYVAKHSCKECTSSLAWAELSDLSDSSTIRFAAKILQQRIFGRIRSHHPQWSVCIFPKKM